MSDETKSQVSIGELFEQLEKIRALAGQAAQKTTEFYERDIALALTDLGHVTADILYVLQEHLSCHDCKIVDHSHQHQPLDTRVSRVFAGEMKE